MDYLDLSGHDYDKYYLRDVMHLGWKGWVEVDRALCEFYGGGESDRYGSSAAADEVCTRSDERGGTSAERMPGLLPTKCWKWKVPGKEVLEDEGAAS